MVAAVMKGDFGMYKSGEYVIYGFNGVCCVRETVIQKRNGADVQYLVLEPVEQPGARYYVPTANPLAMGKLQPIMSKEKLQALLSSKSVKEDSWISDENQRRQVYRELINGGDRAALIRMICALHRHKQAQLAAGRKFHQADENCLRDAQKLINTEFALVLEIPPQKVSEIYFVCDLCRLSDPAVSCRVFCISCTGMRHVDKRIFDVDKMGI